MGFLEDLSKEYVRHRLHGGRQRRYAGTWWGPSGARPGVQRHGYWMRRHPRPGPFGHRRGGVEVRGCGCCLPIPLGLLASVAVAARGQRARTS